MSRERILAEPTVDLVNSTIPFAILLAYVSL